MKLDEFKLLTDENLHPQVVQFLCNAGFDVLDVTQHGLVRQSDLDLLRRAVTENRVVVTHDSDFGTLAVQAGEPVVGILYLRPGHIDPQFTIDTITTVRDMALELTPPFILVAQRRGTRITARLRTL